MISISYMDLFLIISYIFSIGLVTYLAYRDWAKGEDMDLEVFLLAFAIAALGPATLFLFIIFGFCELMSRIDTKKVIIRGRKK